MFEIQEKIDRYLNNNMAISEKKSFEIKIKNDKNLAELIELERDLIDYFGSPKTEFEKQLEQLGKKYFVEKKRDSVIKR